MSITTTITTTGGQSPASAADSPSSSSASAQPPITPLSPNPANPIPVAIPEHIAHQQYLPQQPQQPQQASASGASPNNANVTSPYNIQNHTSAAAAAAAANARRKPSRRANTAERRATHNAVERQRRETLNGRFLDLAALLPNLASVRRPSKSAIVNSSIALIHTQRRMRVIAGRELRALKMEADELRLEVAQWRERSGMPRGPLPEEVPRSREFLEILGTEEVDETWEGWDTTGIEEGIMEEDEGLEEGETEEDMLHHAAQVQAQQHAAALHHHQQQQQQQQAQLRVQHQQQLQRHPYDGIYDPTGVAAVAAAAAYHQQHAQQHQQQQPTPPHAQPQLHPLSIPQLGSNPPSADPTKLAWAPGVYPTLGLHPHAAAAAAPHPQTTGAAQQWAHAAQVAHSALFTPPSTAGGPGSMQQQQQQPPNPFESSASHQAFLASYQRASAAHAAQAVHAQVQAQAQHYVQLGLQQQYQAQMQAHAQAHHAAHPESPTVLQHHSATIGAGGFPHGFGAEDDAESVGSGGHESIHSAGHVGGYGSSQAGAGSPGSDGSVSSGHAHYEAAPPSAVPTAAVDLLALSAGSEYPRRPAVSIPTTWNGNVTPPQTAVGGAKRSPIAGSNKPAAQFNAMTLLA